MAKAKKKSAKEENNFEFLDYCFLALVILVINYFAEILAFVFNIGILIIAVVICWTILSRIKKAIYNYFLPKTIKDINAKIHKIENHQKGLHRKINTLKEENEAFEKRKMTEASTARTIQVVEKQIKLRAQRINLFKTILSLHQKRIQKLTIFKKEYALLRYIAISNQKYDLASGNATQKYANLVTEIDLSIKYDYTTNMNDLVRNIEQGEGEYDTKAAINHLTAIVEKQLEQKQLVNEYEDDVQNDEPQVENELEQLILQDLYKLRMEIQELKAA